VFEGRGLGKGIDTLGWYNQIFGVVQLVSAQVFTHAGFDEPAHVAAQVLKHWLNNDISQYWIVAEIEVPLTVITNCIQLVVGPAGL
jgi:hypothetical protein